MSPRFLLSQTELPLAILDSLSRISEGKQYEDTRQIHFDLQAPRGGMIPVCVEVDGRRALRCEVCDTENILEELRSWLERCLVSDRYGTLHPEIVTLNLVGHVYHMALLHAGWEESGKHPEPVGLLAIYRSDQKKTLLSEFCMITEFVTDLYRGILDYLRKYRSMFDNSPEWYNLTRFDHLNPDRLSDHLIDCFRSEFVENYLFGRKF